MKIRNIDSGIERRIAIGAVVSDAYLARLRDVWQAKLMPTPFVRVVVDWCLSYHDKYGTAPGPDIEQLFESRSDTLPDVDKSLIENFLVSVAEEHRRSEKFNDAYLLDETTRFLHKRSLKRLQSRIGDALAVGDIDAANSAISKWNAVEVPAFDECFPFTDAARLANAFEHSRVQLLSYPGAAGALMGPYAVRDGFLAFLGPEKRGKTWWLIETAIRGMLGKGNVAFFPAGDMSAEQMMVRLAIYNTGRSNDERYCGRLEIPVPDCMTGQLGDCRHEEMSGKHLDVEKDENGKIPLTALIHAFRAGERWTPCSRCKGCKKWKPSIWYKIRPAIRPLTWREALRAGRRFVRSVGGERRLRMSSWPTETLTTDMIESRLDAWERKEGWVADLVIPDYADILAARNASEEHRHRENDKWMSMRRGSLKRHSLWFTATQASAESYDAARLRMKHYSNDKRKYAHVTGMFGLNQTDEEKESGLMRVNTIVVREGGFSSMHEAKVAMSLETGRPCLFSFF